MAFGVRKTRWVKLAIQEVGRDQRTEEHTIGGQEEPHDELLVLDSSRGRCVGGFGNL